MSTAITDLPILSPPRVLPAQRALSRRGVVLGGLGALLAGAVLLALGTGAVAIAPGEALAIVLARLGVAEGGFTQQQALVLLYIRLPRVLMALLAGGALGVSGAALQGLFRNPLADPGLVGVSGGAALAAVMALVLGPAVLGEVWTALQPGGLALAAFAGGMAATLAVYRIATREGRTGVATLLLAGIAVGATAGAGTGLMLFLADDQQLRDITFWSLGSLGGATWHNLPIAAPLFLIAFVGLLRLSRPLNALLLGEAEAFHLGVNVERAKRQAVVLTALGVGAAVAVCGVIGFVGLVVPHLVRLVAGPDHRVLLPASALLGALLLLLADVFARTIAAPAELPVGIVTAAVGAPFFLWLLVRERGRL